MNTISRQTLIVIILWLILSGCSGKAHLMNSSESSFQTAVPMANMNQSLEINVDGDNTSFRIGAEIPLIVQNKSADYIFFTGDDYIRLFILQDLKWIEIKSELTYSGSKVLSPKGTPLLDLDRTWAQPALDGNIFSDKRSDLLLRILITGEIMENDVRTGKLISAFVDVHMVP